MSRLLGRRLERRSVAEDAGPHRSTLASQTYLEQARWAATWQRDRADAFERKAVALLGFNGVIIALSPRLVPLISETRGSDVRQALKLLAAVAAVSLFVSMVCALLTLRRRRYAAPWSLDQISDEWASYKDSGTTDEEVVVAMFANMLIGSPDHPLQSLSYDATSRGRAFAWGTRFLALGATALATILIVLLLTREY